MAAYSGSSRRPEQLSYINYFHPSYGLFSMDLQSFIDFAISEFIIISELNSQILFIHSCN